MSFASGPVFTAAGRTLHARAMAGATLTFTKMQIGNGDINGSIESMTALDHPVAAVDISAITRSGNFVTVTGLFSNDQATIGFYWKEIGLFAADPDAPNDRSRDILYCYQNAGNLADYIPAAESELITKRISIASIVDNVANVTATLTQPMSAEQIDFDNTGSTFTAANVQAALVEVGGKQAKHAAQHKTGGADALTPSDIGAVSTSGGTMTGPLEIQRAGGSNFGIKDQTSGAVSRFGSSGHQATIQASNVAGDATNFRMLRLRDSDAAADLLSALQLYVRVNGANSVYNIAHEGNIDILAPKQVFIAQYGVTTSEQLSEAYTAGKIMLCKGTDDDGEYTAILSMKTATDFVFTASLGGRVKSYICLAGTLWMPLETKYYTTGEVDSLLGARPATVG